MPEKKPDLTDYIPWLKEHLKVSEQECSKFYYEYVANTLKQGFESSPLWLNISEELATIGYDYKAMTGYALLDQDKPNIVCKEFDSFILKTYRKNILFNNNWPDAPRLGWLLPENWYSRVNDIVRTLIVVKYFDGVEFITERIKGLAKKNSIEMQVHYEAREEGYYAAHLYLSGKAEIRNANWDSRFINTTIEIQITTQVQEVIRDLLHKYYDQKRRKPSLRDVKWQWKNDSEEFRANYLGHILHYVEGMILQIRKTQVEKEE